MDVTMKKLHSPSFRPDKKTVASLFKTRKTMRCVYCASLSLIVLAGIVLLHPYSNSSFFLHVIPSKTSASSAAGNSSPSTSYAFASVLSFVYHERGSPTVDVIADGDRNAPEEGNGDVGKESGDGVLPGDDVDGVSSGGLWNGSVSGGVPAKNESVSGESEVESGVYLTNPAKDLIPENSTGNVTLRNGTVAGESEKDSRNAVQNSTARSRIRSPSPVILVSGNSSGTGMKNPVIGSVSPRSVTTTVLKDSGNVTATFPIGKGGSSVNGTLGARKPGPFYKCDVFDGKWVRDDSYPLFQAGSCPFIDEPFDCYLNGRPDRKYENWRWQPNHCTIPRLNPIDMLERLRGKRVVYVGDSLNRNMWESLVCVLRNAVPDKKSVFEASGQREFRTEGSYSIVFTDYNCSIEFFRSPFLVQEWETPQPDGTMKETLRLDLIDRAAPKYKNADILVFNTGHWWTHEKTSLGKDYYQEGDHVYSELGAEDAYGKALRIWAKWVDDNVNPKKTLLFFRGYSSSHFSGGQWNSGGMCDNETEPIMVDTYLNSYPPKMKILDNVLANMNTPVSYLNITRLTDYRKDAHPSIYRKQNLTEEERRSPEIYQDCSHWCLPGVPDIWNEFIYARLRNVWKS